MREIVFSLNNKIATISLNKAQTKNSLNRNDLKQITEFLKKIKNMNLICLIISSSGDTFSSGMNFKELSIGDWSKNPISEVCDKIEKLPFISICKINGAIYGGSVELAISTDFRIDQKIVKFIYRQVNLEYIMNIKELKDVLIFLVYKLPKGSFFSEKY